MGKILTFTKDTLVSLVNGLGRIGQDKAASVGYMAPMYTDEMLTEMYRASWLTKKIVRIPAQDSFRKWRAWQAEEADIGRIEDLERALDVKKKLLTAMTWGRLYGGAAVYIGILGDDPATPLEVERIRAGSLQYLNLIPKTELSPGEIVRDITSEYYGAPEFYELGTSFGERLQIHASRLVIFKGEELPSTANVSGALMGWGDSVITSTISAIQNADSTLANIASLVFEAKVDIIQVPDLMAQLADPEYKSRLLDRFQLAHIAKGNNATLLLDKEEEYNQKVFQFGTLPDVAMTFLQVVSGAADIPATRLLGQTPGGLQSTGESDLRNYYDRLQSEQELNIDPQLKMLNECLIRSATGVRKPDTHYIWASLWQVSDRERAEIGKIQAETIATLNNTGLFPQEALANAGANMLVESSVMPGFIEEIETAGGLPDYDLEAEKEAEAEMARLEAQGNPPVDDE